LKSSTIGPFIQLLSLNIKREFVLLFTLELLNGVYPVGLIIVEAGTNEMFRCTAKHGNFEVYKNV